MNKIYNLSCIKIVLRVSLHREHRQADKMIVKKLIMRDYVVCFIVEKRTLSVFIIKIVVHTLIQ